MYVTIVRTASAPCATPFIAEPSMVTSSARLFSHTGWYSVAGTRTPSKRVTYIGVPPSAAALLSMDMSSSPGSGIPSTPELADAHVVRVASQALDLDLRKPLAGHVAVDDHRERVGEVRGRAADKREGCSPERIGPIDDPHGRARGAARLQGEALVLGRRGGQARAQAGAPT